MTYFIEGLQGAGKTTLVANLSKKLPEHKVFREGDYSPVELAWCAYLAEDQYAKILSKYSKIADEIRQNTTEEMYGSKTHYVVTYTQILTDIPGFHKDLEQYEIYNGRIDKKTFEDIIFSRYSKWDESDQIFECSIFQNIIENQILFYEMTDDEITDFYIRLKEIIKDKQFKILYLEVENIAETLEIIRKERVDSEGNEIWFQLMMGFLKECPYGISHGLRDFNDLVKHLEHRMNLELKIIKEVFPDNSIILKSKDYDLETRVVPFKLETERLILREMTTEDFDSLYAVLADPDIMQHYPYSFDEERVHSWIKRNRDRYQQYGFGLWAVCLKDTGEMIGDCGLTLQNIDGKQLPEIGYHIRKDQQHNGYAKEAAIAVRNWAFRTTSYPALYSYCKYTNIPSIRTAESIGMKPYLDYKDEDNGITHVSVIFRNQ